MTEWKRTDIADLRTELSNAIINNETLPAGVESLLDRTITMLDELEKSLAERWADRKRMADAIEEQRVEIERLRAARDADLANELTATPSPTGTELALVECKTILKDLVASVERETRSGKRLLSSTIVYRDAAKKFLADVPQ